MSLIFEDKSSGSSLTLYLPLPDLSGMKIWPFYSPRPQKMVPRSAATHASLCNTVASHKLSPKSVIFVASKGLSKNLCLIIIVKSQSRNMEDGRTNKSENETWHIHCQPQRQLNYVSIFFRKCWLYKNDKCQILVILSNLVMRILLTWFESMAIISG